MIGCWHRWWSELLGFGMAGNHYHDKSLRYQGNFPEIIGIHLNRVVTTLFGSAGGHPTRRAWKNRCFCARARPAPASVPQTWVSLGELRALEADAAQGAQENVGEGSKPPPQLIGAHGRRRGAVGEQVGLAFLDPVLHVAAGAIDLLVKTPCVGLLYAERGDDEMA